MDARAPDHGMTTDNHYAALLWFSDALHQRLWNLPVDMIPARVRVRGRIVDRAIWCVKITVRTDPDILFEFPIFTNTIEVCVESLERWLRDLRTQDGAAHSDVTMESMEVACVKRGSDSSSQLYIYTLPSPNPNGLKPAFQ